MESMQARSLDTYAQPMYPDNYDFTNHALDV
jgi:hypothetical protein